VRYIWNESYSCSMLPKGHFGLALLLSSILATPYGFSDFSIFVIGVSVLVSTIPDLDVNWRVIGIKHRGKVSHSLFTAIVLGVMFGGLFYYIGVEWFWFNTGFIGGFLGITSHLLGDILTYHSFQPLWPLSQMEISFRLCRANSRIVNNTLFFLGGMGLLFFLVKNFSI